VKILKTQQDLEFLKDIDDLAFVPTMGALHDGHLALVKAAQEKASKVVVSIFVNPTQFGPKEDLDQYPRPIEEDIAKLEKLAVDFLFLPGLELIYPDGEKITHKADKGLSNALCALSRPGHFDGVVTVVYKLFDLIKPQCAVFGEKDFQQLLIIEAMVKKENLNIEIIRAPIYREADGLAMSSRNQYLSKDQRELAPLLYNGLLRLQKSEISSEDLKKELETKSFQVDYVEKLWRRLFIAAKIGSTRLIDNIAA
jgi:pantoate--beta-alanine ligase